MGFESVRGYVQLASGLSELTRARAMEAAQGLLSLPAAGIATGSKVAVQAGALAEELLAAATANRSNLTDAGSQRGRCRGHPSGAGARAQKLEEAQAEATRLRAEVARLRSMSAQGFTPKSTAKKAAAPKSTAKKAAAPKSTAKKATTARRSAVTTRAKPDGHVSQHTSGQHGRSPSGGPWEPWPPGAGSRASANR